MQSEEKYYLKDAIVEQVNRFMGWCPHAHQRTFRMDSPTGAVLTPADSSGGGLSPFSFGWTNRYRTRALGFALCMTGVGISLFATATGDRVVMLGIGLFLATLLWFSDAFTYWNLFRDVERYGIADEKDWKQISVVRVLPVIGVALILGFAGAVILGLVPGLSMLMVNGFLSGFAAIGWYHLATILLWERRSGIVLFSDGTRIYRRSVP